MINGVLSRLHASGYVVRDMKEVPDVWWRLTAKGLEACGGPEGERTD